MREIKVLDLTSPTPYRKAHDLQLETLRRLKCGDLPSTLILVEHPPVITLGRNSTLDQITATDEELLKYGVEVIKVERGGEATLHLPGQLVAYPVINIRRLKLGVKEYVNGLEEVMIKTVADFGVEAKRVAGKPGIYTKKGKLGALGIAVTGGYAYHGIALNVNPDLNLYRLIIPCGDPEGRATSLAVESSSTNVEMKTVKESLAANFSEVLGLTVSYP